MDPKHISDSENDIENIKEKLRLSDSDSDAFEAVLQHMGEMGLYQKLLFFAMAPFGFVFAFNYYTQMFITATPSHWCRVPELEHLDVEIRRNLTTVTTAEGWENCLMYDANWTQVLQNMIVPSNTTLVPCQHGWEFQLTNIPYHTVVSERGWVCENASNVPFAQSMAFVGSFLGGILFGWMADFYGRVPAIMGTYLIALIGGVGSIYTSGLWDFAFCRFLVGMSFDSCFVIIYILVLEYVGPTYRSLVGNISIALFYGGGAIMLPWVSIWLGDWRKLLWFTISPLLILFLIPFVIPESARWLSSRGRSKKAIEVLRRFEKLNGRKIPDDVLDEFVISSNKQKISNESLKDVFKSHHLRKMLFILSITSMFGVIVFDTLVRMCHGLGLDFFVTFTMVSATEVPSVILVAVTLDRFGRRKLTFVPTVLTAILAITATFVPKGIPRVAIAVLARFMTNMTLTVLMQWTAELLPTPVRASGSSFVHVISFLATMVSPFIAFSERLWFALPFIIISGISLCAASITLLLPETKGRQMPQTIIDGEKIVQSNTLCGSNAESEQDLPKRRSLIT
ncbi:beta-alanine transporter [Pieris rapae]|uniref:beta-alanine transporter n=1 Tax=Pieris rapae TaxID=64459 RepID=UPI001E27B70F|nr:beta-alanine transporter [Pieris rapae]